MEAAEKKPYTGRYAEFINDMEDGKARKYLTTTVIPQMDYYSRNSAKYKKKFVWFSIISIICNGVIPFLVIIGENFKISFWTEMIIALISAVSAILTAIAALLTYRELWVKYRLTLESLKCVVNKYFLRTGEFAQFKNNESKALDLLESSCSTIMSEEHNAWTHIISGEKSEQ